MTGALPGTSSVLHLKEIDSTQNLAKAMAEQGAAEGFLVWADRQSRGRGRMDRTWTSADGGLYFSLILRPRFPPARLAAFGLMAAASVAEALARAARVTPAVKPPNDVMIDGAKVSGVLAEASGSGRSLDWLVLGVGVNVNNRPPHGAASLRSKTGKKWEIEEVLRAILAQFMRRYGRFQ